MSSADLNHNCLAKNKLTFADCVMALSNQKRIAEEFVEWAEWIAGSLDAHDGSRLLPRVLSRLALIFPSVGANTEDWLTDKGWISRI
jgi:hypothetical protein